MLNHWNLHSTLFIRLPPHRARLFPFAQKLSFLLSLLLPGIILHKHSLYRKYLYMLWTTKRWKLWGNSESIITQKFRIFGDMCSGNEANGVAEDIPSGKGRHLILGSSLMFLCYLLAPTPPAMLWYSKRFVSFFRRIIVHSKELSMTCFFYILSHSFRPFPSPPLRCWSTRKIWL